MKTVVVGAGGTLGALVATRLGASAIEVRASGLGPDGYVAEVGDADVVVNVSGPRVRGGLKWADYFREHVSLTSALARSMRTGARLVHISSTAVYGARGDWIPRDAAEAPTRFPSAPYACAKLAAEVSARALGAERGLSVIVLRPSMVYGPGVDSALDTIRRAATRGVRLLLRPRELRQHLVHVELFLEAVARAVRMHSPPPGVLVVADPFVLTNADLERPAGGVSVPIPLELATKLDYGLHSSGRVGLMVEALAVLAMDNVFDTAATFEALGIEQHAFGRQRTFDPYWRGES